MVKNGICGFVLVKLSWGILEMIRKSEVVVEGEKDLWFVVGELSVNNVCLYVIQRIGIVNI